MKISEEQFEDWAEKDVTRLVEGEDVRLIGRQVQVPNHRRMDLVASRTCRTCGYPNREMVVVELKAKKAGTEAIVQMLEYVGYFRGSLEIAYDDDTPQDSKFCHVDGVLATPDLTDEAKTVMMALQPAHKHVSLGVSISSSGSYWRKVEAPASEPIVEFLRSTPRRYSSPQRAVMRAVEERISEGGEEDQTAMQLAAHITNEYQVSAPGRTDLKVSFWSDGTSEEFGVGEAIEWLQGWDCRRRVGKHLGEPPEDVRVDVREYEESDVEAAQ